MTTTVTRARVPPDVPRRRFTVDEYYRMAEAGILHEDDPVELLDGEIIEMSPIGDRHFGCVLFAQRWFYRRLGDRAFVSVQGPVQLSSGSEPEPDIVLLRPRPDHYRSGKPSPADVLLLIEVADTTLAYDRDVKLRFYAESGLREVWIVDLNAAQILVFREPAGLGYNQRLVVGREGTLSPLAFPYVTLSVGDLLGQGRLL